MKFVAVIKTRKDVPARKGFVDLWEALPPHYPVSIREFEAENLGKAKMLYPGKLVVDIKRYREYVYKMQAKHIDILGEIDYRDAEFSEAEEQKNRSK